MSTKSVDYEIIPSDEPHAPLLCSICGTEQAFLGYGQKTGKDGRVAKWPVFEKCDKKLHKVSRTMTQEQLQTGAVFETPVRIVQGRSGPKGNVYQLVSKTPADLQRDLKRCLQYFQEKHSCEPVKLLISPVDLDAIFPGSDKPETFEGYPIEISADLTPGYRYVFMELPKTL